MNPYAGYLGDHDPHQVIGATAAALAEILQKVDLDQPAAPGKWTPREIIAHLADTEIVFAFRLRQAVAEKDYVIQPFDQDAWAANYKNVDAKAALAVFTRVRQWNVAFIDSLPVATFAKTLSHPERGPMTLQTVVETMAGHDLNHLRQFRS